MLEVPNTNMKRNNPFVFNERSKWKRTENLNIWKDQHGNIRNMTSKEPENYKNGDGFQISSVTQLTTFLPKNIAGVMYNDPHRHYGSNADCLYIDNEKMLLFLNGRIGKLCDEKMLSRSDDFRSKKFKGAKALFENSGGNILFSEIQKLFCQKTCLFDSIGYHKLCENHLSLDDIAEIDPLTSISGFLEELSLYDEFREKPFPKIDIDLLKANSGRTKGEKLNNLNGGRLGQYEAWKFLIVLISLYTCLEEKIDRKIGSFTTDQWSEAKLYFKSSHVEKESGFAPPPLAEWGWGPEYYPMDNPCTEFPPCNSCVKDYNKNAKVEPTRHWMNFHYNKDECPGSKTFPGSFNDHRNPQSHKKPEYIDGKFVYYCNIGGCPEDCECSDCSMEATEQNNTQCKDHIPDHPENFDEEKHIQYPRKMFTEKEVQKEFLPIKLPKMEKSCDICQDNVFEHRFYHRSYHLFCNACVFMKHSSEQSFENICKYCLKIFKDKYKLKNHLGVHQNLFKCEPCEKQFACKQTLEKHKEEFHVKKEEMNFTCTVCDVKCSNLRNLSAHKKTHEAPSETFKCALCPRDSTFKQARSLRRHYLNVHKIVPNCYMRPNLDLFIRHTCGVCGKEFDRKGRLEKHKEQKSCLNLSLLHFNCNYCDFRTIYKRNLLRHLRKHTFVNNK